MSSAHAYADFSETVGLRHGSDPVSCRMRRRLEARGVTISTALMAPDPLSPDQFVLVTAEGEVLSLDYSDYGYDVPSEEDDDGRGLVTRLEPRSSADADEIRRCAIRYRTST